MKACPVCGRAGLADDVRECPQCHADLECFELLDSLQEELVTPQPPQLAPPGTKELAEIRASLQGIRETLGRRRAWMRRYAMSALFVLALSALILFVYRDLANERRFADRVSRLELRTRSVEAELKARERSELIAKMAAITQRLDAMENELSAVSANQAAAGGRFSAPVEDLNKISEGLMSLQQRLSELTAALSPRADALTVPSGPAREEAFLYHEPSKGETLWSIARRYYDNGRLYPVLLEHNPGLGIYFDRGYGRIKVLKDRERAKQVLAEVISARGKRSLFRYKVVAGDSWARIAKRFFGQAGKATELAALNPRVGLAPGERVLVPLP